MNHDAILNKGHNDFINKVRRGIVHKINQIIKIKPIRVCASIPFSVFNTILIINPEEMRACINRTALIRFLQKLC